MFDGAGDGGHRGNVSSAHQQAEGEGESILSTPVQPERHLTLHPTLGELPRRPVSTCHGRIPSPGWSQLVSHTGELRVLGWHVPTHACVLLPERNVSTLVRCRAAGAQWVCI